MFTSCFEVYGRFEIEGNASVNRDDSVSALPNFLYESFMPILSDSKITQSNTKINKTVIDRI